MNKTTIAALAAALISATTAVSADDTKKFDGVFAGVEAGYVDFGSGIDAFIYGIEAGYRKQLDNNVVIGIEGTLSDADLNGVDFIWSTTATLGRAFGTDNKHLIFLGAGFAQLNAENGTGEAFKADLGYEYALDNGISFRTKLSTYEFDSVQVTGGLSYRF